MRLRPLTVFFACAPLLACGGSDAPGPEHAGPDEGTSMSRLQQLNARAREGAVLDTIHGVEVEDPYRTLETESELTRDWITQQTARSAARLAEWADAGAAARLDELLSIGVVGAPQVRGERTFYTKRDGEREQPQLFVREGETLRPLIDPLTYGERAALDWYFASPSGRYVAFGISTAGDERSTLRVLDLEDGELEPDLIDHAKWSSVAWLHSEEGFYYRRYPREGEPDYDAGAEDTYHMRLFFHRLGSDTAEDPLLFAPEEGTDFPSVSVSEDDRWLTLGNFHGWSQSDLFVFDRGASRRGRRDVPDVEHPFVPVIEGEDHLYYGNVHRGRLYVVHNDGAPRYQIDSIDPADPGERADWDNVLAEGAGAIEGMEIAGDRLIVHTIEDISSHLRAYRLNGALDREIELPGRGEIFGLSTDETTGRVALGFSSFVHPPALFGFGPRAPELREIDRVETNVDFDAVELSQASVPSADGTPINVYYVHPRGMELDSSHRVLLTAYGGFNVSLLPGFQRNALYWVERGGVYAVANLRGGGELGEEWHRAGNRGNKPRVFEDMEAVTRWLGGESHISRPERIAITGGSNGGLLMGAMITRAPDAFGATVANVGLYDMVRYHRFPPAELWISEYGNADEDAEQLGWLHGYSPYHRVEDGTDYPAILITTADHDTRVHWAHSTKFAARLQEASGEPDPDIFFYMLEEQGHGAGTRRSDTVQRYVRLYSFVEHFIGRPGSD